MFLRIEDGNGALIDQYSYAYDANGNLTSVTETQASGVAGTTLYAYDSQNQLTKETYPDGSWVAYSYDELGNRTSVSRSDGTTLTYTYNNPEKNRLVEIRDSGGKQLNNFSYDANGNLTGDGNATYSWDTANRLKQATAGSSVYSYTYDALGRRASKTVNSVTERYAYDGSNVAFVTDASGNVLRSFEYDTNGRPVLMRQNGNAYYYQYDTHGDVIRMSDLNGNSVAQYTYDAWGNITSESGTLAHDNPYRYAAYWFDEETGLYYLNARYYSPKIGRFIAADKILGSVSAPLTLNKFAYVSNAPLGHTDPSGLYEKGDDGTIYRQKHMPGFGAGEVEAKPSRVSPISPVGSGAMASRNMERISYSTISGLIASVSSLISVISVFVPVLKGASLILTVTSLILSVWGYGHGYLSREQLYRDGVLALMSFIAPTNKITGILDIGTSWTRGIRYAGMFFSMTFGLGVGLESVAQGLSEWRSEDAR